MTRIKYIRTLMKVNYYILIFGLIASQAAFSQLPFPEFTKQLVKLNKEDLPEKIDELASGHLKKNPKADKNIQLWKYYVSDSLRLKTEADSLVKIIIPKYKGTYPLIDIRAYIRLGNLSNDANDFEKAIQYFFEAQSIAEKLKNNKVLAIAKRNIGLSYMKLDENKTAQKYLLSSLKLYEKDKDSAGIANVTISLGNVYKDLGLFDEAEKYYFISLELSKKQNNQRLLAGLYNNLGNLERRRGNKEEALDYFLKATEMNKKSGNKLWLSFNYNNIGNTYSDLKKYHKAIEFYKLSNELKYELNDSLSLMTGFQGLSDAYLGINDYKNAFHYLKKYIELKDTLNIVNQANMLKDFEARYESEKQAILIKQLTTDEKLQAEKNKTLELKVQRNWNLVLLFIFAGVILMGGIALLLRSNKAKKQTNDLLNSKNIEIQNSNFALQETLKQLSKKNKEIIDSINYATYIQRASLPNIAQQTTDFLHFELFFSPKDIVSGDFYFSYQLYNKSIFGVADCTGHGVPGAMVSLVGMNSLDKVVREESHTDSADMVESLNKHVLESLHRGDQLINDGMDISFCYLDHEARILHFTGAHHNAFILREGTYVNPDILSDHIQVKIQSENKTLFVLNGARRPIGKTHSRESFFEVQFDVQQSDRIILFSDGYADQIGGGNDKKLKKGKMLDLIMDSANKSVSEQMQFLKDQFEIWQGKGEQVDDVCMLITEIKK